MQTTLTQEMGCEITDSKIRVIRVLCVFSDSDSSTFMVELSYNYV